MAGQTRAYLGWWPRVGAGPHKCWRARGGAQRLRETESRLQDPLVLDEIELYGELVIAASSSDSPLSQSEIDRVLGVTDRDSGGGPPV
ncbi:MAG: hypothetical protein QOE01_198 [Actinomycetota bacterium]|nr:hypothetical protein [Actinomycetota bacterium]